MKTTEVQARATKPSGIPWLGEVPAHWEVKRLKYLASINDDALPESADPTQEIVYVEIGGVDAVEGIVAKEQLVLEDAPSRARRLVRHGDTVVSTVRTYLRAIAPIHDPEPNLVVSTGFAVIRPRELDPDYLGYALRSPLFIETIVSRSTGVSYPGINASEIGNIEVAYPPLPEQRAIAAFLDERTARIDALVARKRRLVQLLKEKRQALITRAVTRGLDPKVKMKESGVPWLGEVPEGWGLCQLKYAVTFQRGHDLAADERTEGTVPVITSAGSTGSHDKAIAQAPGIVTGRYGTIGEFYLIEQDYWPLNTTLYSIDLRGNDVRFLAYLLNNLKEVFLVNSLKSAVPGVDRNDLHSILVAVPKTVAEQVTIVNHLDRTTQRLDALVSKVEQAVERLQEYRTALISAAVTGKVRIPMGRSEDQMIGQ